MIKVVKVVKEIKQCFCNGCEKLIAEEYDKNFEIDVDIARYTDEIHICSICQHKISQYIKTTIRRSILDGEFKNFLSNSSSDINAVIQREKDQLNIKVKDSLKKIRGEI